MHQLIIPRRILSNVKSLLAIGPSKKRDILYNSERQCSLILSHQFSNGSSRSSQDKTTHARLKKLKRKQEKQEEILSSQGTKIASIAAKWNEKEVVKYEIPFKPGDKKDISQPLPKGYSPAYVEAVWYEWWEKMGFFKPLKKSPGSKAFVMCLPPPNVTGTLHLGHTLTVAIEDSIVRWNRMCGRETLWLPGCDHAGIATQVVVEKQLMSQTGHDRHDLGREKFIQEVWKWKYKKGDEIYKQLKRLGSSLDWTRERFTMDEVFSRAVTEAFIRLHEDGTIYRSNRLVNWSCALKSAISDIEVDQVSISGRTPLSVPGYEDKILFGCLEEFAYPLENSGDEVIVATTRIETMLGDTAIAVNPDDQRYAHLVGGAAVHPFTGRRLPIIADPFVDKEFGTGAVKVTPGHDHNDYEIGKRHDLATITVIGEDGNMADTAAQFQGMKRFLARTAVLEALKEKNLYRGTKDNPMVVPICSRSKDIVEPLVKSQWFVNCTEMAAAAVKAVEDGDLEIIPDMHIKTWNQWLKNSRDWCLSRQLWWGHRIPAYFVTINDDAHPAGKDTDVHYWVSAHTEEEARQKAAQRFDVEASKIALTQDEDVLDTWFSSGIFPFAVHGWPEKTPDLLQYYPSTLLETGYDILFFWVARMVMLGQRLTGEIPFKQVYLHSMVRDAHGRKMSKSFGNVIDPLDVIEGISLDALQDRLRNGNLKHNDRELNIALKGQRADYPSGIPECGTDALRFALCTYKAQGDDISLSVQQVLEYRHFCNKIWNAVKFSLAAFGDDLRVTRSEELTQNCRTIDRWILSKLSHTADICNAGFQSYNLTVVTSALHHFWLQCLCDVYLEAIKPLLKDESTPADVSRSVLFTCVNAGLRLLSPFMPYLTEELYQRLPGLDDVSSICVAKYPTIKELPYKDVALEEDTDLMLGVARSIRSLKVQYEMKQVNAFVVCRTDDAHSTLCNFKEDLHTLTKAASLQLIPDGVTPSGCAVATVSPSCDVAVQIKGIVDIPNIMKKLKMKETKLNSQLAKLVKATEIPNYNEKVPDKIQQQTSDKIHQLALELQNVDKMLETLQRTKS